MPTIELPPVTDAHRRQAFALFKWPASPSSRPWPWICAAA